MKFKNNYTVGLAMNDAEDATRAFNRLVRMCSLDAEKILLMYTAR